MHTRYLIIALCFLLPMAASAGSPKVYKWTDEDGNVHFGDSIPPQYAEQPKQVLNDQGVTVGRLEGRKTEQELDAERTARETAAAREQQRMADEALLAERYEREIMNPEEALSLGSVSEIVMPADLRRVLAAQLAFCLRHYEPGPMQSVQREFH